MQGGSVQDGVGLKGLLLRGIVTQLFPRSADKSVTQRNISLESVLQAASLIESQQLLRETVASTSNSAAEKLHKDAVEQWCNGTLDSLEGQAAGLSKWTASCLAGLTCRECGAHRFLGFYQALATRLLSTLKESEEVEIQTAVLAALGDLVGRLGQLLDVPGVRREGAGVVGRIVQPLIGALSGPASLNIASESLDLLTVCLQSFPSPFRHHSEAVETAVISLLIRSLSEPQPTSSQLVNEAAQALALLPHAAGDAATWSTLIRRILIALNTLLTPTLSGLEKPAAFDAAASLLLPQGSAIPPPFGHFDWSISDASSSHLWASTIPLLTSLLTAVQLMLTSHYPAAVAIPTAPILAIVSRILKVGASLSSAAGAYDTLAISRRASISAELPNLQTLAFDSVRALLASARTHMLPHAEQLVSLVTDALRQSAGGVYGGSSFRMRVYGAATELLAGLGSGASLILAPTLVSHALSDLRSAHQFLTQPRTADASALHLSDILQPQGADSVGGKRGGKRRKVVGDVSTGGVVPAGQEAEEAFRVAGGALGAMEKLLAVGGPLIPEEWRSELDAAVYQVAQLTSASHPVLRLAAHRALLASLTSPRRHRPPFLPQALALFRRGRLENGTEVGAFSTYALLVLEPFLHPRSLPVLRLPQTSASAFGGSLLGDNSAPQGGAVPFGNDPWQEAKTWLGYGAGFRHGLQEPMLLTSQELEIGRTSEASPSSQEELPRETKAGTTNRAENLPGNGNPEELNDMQHEVRSAADVTMTEAAESEPVMREPAEGPPAFGEPKTFTNAGGKEKDVAAESISIPSAKGSADEISGQKVLHTKANGKRPREDDALAIEEGPVGNESVAEVGGTNARREDAEQLSLELLWKSSLQGKTKPAKQSVAKTEKAREAELAREAARNVFGLQPKAGGDSDVDSEGSLPSIVDGDPDDDDFM